MRNRYILIVVIGVLFFTSCKTSNKPVSSTDSQSGSKKNLSERERWGYDLKFYEADKQQILGNYEQAASLFADCIKIDATNPAAYYELAKIYQYGGDKDKSLEFSGKAANMDQKNTWYQLLYADCLFAKKKYEETAEIYQRIIKINPDKIEMYFELAESYVYANKPQEALKVYDKIEQKVGPSEENSLQKIQIYKQMKGKDKEAIAELNKLIQLNPKQAKYYGMLGELYLSNGQKEKALQAYNDLLKIDPSNAFVHLSLAQYYYAEKQEDKGFEEYKEAFKNDKLDIDTKAKILAWYYESAEKKPAMKLQGEELSKIMVDAHPDDAKAYFIYGNFLLQDKKLTEARDAYRKANARDKTQYIVWAEVLDIDSHLNDFESMLFDSKQTMELFPAQPAGYLYSGVANLEKKNYTQAITVLKEGKDYVVDNNPLLAQFYTSLGDAYERTKDYKASDEAYEKALEIDSKNVYVLNNYAYYLSLRKEKLERAEEMSKKTVDIEPNNNSYLDTYGWILYQKGSYEEAKKWIGKALDNGARSNGVILEHYGDVLYKLGETDKALEYWNQAKQNGGASEFLDKKIADKKLYE